MSFMHSMKKVSHQASKIAKSAENAVVSSVDNTQDLVDLSNQCKDLVENISQLCNAIGLTDAEVLELAEEGAMVI